MEQNPTKKAPKLDLARTAHTACMFSGEERAQPVGGLLGPGPRRGPRKLEKRPFWTSNSKNAQEESMGPIIHDHDIGSNLGPCHRSDHFSLCLYKVRTSIALTAQKRGEVNGSWT